MVRYGITIDVRKFDDNGHPIKVLFVPETILFDEYDKALECSRELNKVLDSHNR